MAQKMVATKGPTAGQPISLRTADHAMIAPHPNAAPKMAWGSGRTRLASGYRTAKSSAMGDRAIVKGLSRKTREAAIPISARKTATAAPGCMRPDARGRSRVRWTRRSRSRSQRSLIVTPALRMTNTPATKIAVSGSGGGPGAPGGDGRRGGERRERGAGWFGGRGRGGPTEQERGGRPQAAPGGPEPIAWWGGRGRRGGG